MSSASSGLELAGFFDVLARASQAVQNFATISTNASLVMQAAQTPLQIGQTSFAIRQQLNSTGFGLPDYLANNLGIGTPLWQQQSQNQQVAGANELFDRQVQRLGVQDTYTQQELTARVAHLNQRPSKQLETLATINEQAAEQQATVAFGAQMADLEYQKKAVLTKFGATSDPKQLAAQQAEMDILDQKEDQARSERDKDIEHAKKLRGEQVLTAKEVAKTEAVEKSNAQSQYYGYAALRAGAGGADEMFQRQQEQELATQKERQRRGQSTQTDTDTLGAKQAFEKEQREREIAQRTKDVTSEGQEAVLQTEGKFYDARREAFERAAQDRILAARNLGQGEIDATKKTIDEQRALMEHQIALEKQQQQNASNLTIRQSQYRAEGDTLRAQGAFYKADEAAYAASWDSKIEKAKDAVDDTDDVIKKAQRQRELEVLQEERKADEAAHAYTKSGGTRDLAIRQEQIEDTRLEARGQYQTEQLKRTTDKAYRDIAEAHGNKDLQTSIADQAKADIEKQEFDIKRRSLGQLGRSARHSFEIGADNLKPLENLNDVMTSADASLKSIDKYLREQVAKTTP